MSVSPNLKYLQKKLNYQFNELPILQMALTHRSASSQHNERLEYLGDAVLGSIIAHQLYLQFPQADEGQLSRLRSFLVKEKALYELAQQINLGDYLNLGSGELKSGGFRRASILSDAFEAIIGAVYLDSDFISTQQFVLGLYQEKLAKLSLDMAQKDPKTRLQEWLQARNFETPEYEVIRSTGKDHAKSYWVSCNVEYQSIKTEGFGASRRKAEQDAAAKVLEKLVNDK
ncbi:ribonuclease III [Aliikangiella maris]|uniref:Ribonuclease III n=2 Tax=Aliikangiella maris TaxID=3162458 RepID=A0ABV2BSM8_9GAMM